VHKGVNQTPVGPHLEPSKLINDLSLPVRSVVRSTLPILIPIYIHTNALSCSYGAIFYLALVFLCCCCCCCCHCCCWSMWRCS